MIENSSKPVVRCQISNSNKLKSIIFLGFLPPVNTLRKINSIPLEEKSFPAELLYCNKSKLAQLGCIVDKKILFPYSYPYTSSTTKILRENFADLYKDINKIVYLCNRDLIIDIGSNDGNLLENFKNNHRVLGVTPEKIGKLAIKKGIPTTEQIPSLAKYMKRRSEMKIKEITSAEEQLELLRMIIDNTWTAIRQQAEIQAKQGAAQVSKPKTPKPSKKPPYAAPPKPLPKPQQQIARPEQIPTKPATTRTPEELKAFQDYLRGVNPQTPQTNQNRSLLGEPPVI